MILEVGKCYKTLEMGGWFYKENDSFENFIDYFNTEQQFIVLSCEIIKTHICYTIFMDNKKMFINYPPGSILERLIHTNKLFQEII